MQVLTGQYQQLFTHKFRVFFSDFSPITLNFGKCKLLDVPKGYQVISTMITCEEIFAGGSISSASIRIHDSSSLKASDSVTGQFNSYNPIAPLGDNRGVFLPTPNRAAVIGGVNRNIILNRLAYTSIYATLQVNNTGGLAALTAGRCLVWVQLCRFA